MDNNELKDLFKPNNFKEKVLNNIPFGFYFLLFVLTLFFELCNAKFDFSTFITAQFWIELTIKYLFLVASFLILYPTFFKSYKNSDNAYAVSKNAEEAKKRLVSKGLTKTCMIYTKDKMLKEEREFFEDLLLQCGNIDCKYLDSDYSISDIKQDYKNKYILKIQYKLLKKIKNGSIKFYKLKGDEIRYVETIDTSKNEKYIYRNKRVIKHEFSLKFLTMMAFGIVIQLILNSAFDKFISLKSDYIQVIISFATTICNYSMAVIFSKQVAEKVFEEWERYIKVVTNFFNDFIDEVERGLYIIPKEDTANEKITSNSNINSTMVSNNQRQD